MSTEITAARPLFLHGGISIETRTRPSGFIAWDLHLRIAVSAYLRVLPVVARIKLAINRSSKRRGTSSGTRVQPV